MGFLTNPPDRNLDQAGMAAGHGQAAPSTKNHLGETRKVSNEESGTDLDESDAILLAMGYKPEMARNRSTLQVAFMSFVLASIPYGLATTFTYPLTGGGPANIIWGWIMVSLIIICVAASLGEITSVYPTAGGVYYQTFMLAPTKYKRVLSWICGWAYVVGNITITLAVNFGSALFIIACVNVFESSPGVGIWNASAWETFLVFVAITVFCNLVSSLGNRWLALVDVCETGLLGHLWILTMSSRLLPSSGLLLVFLPFSSSRSYWLRVADTLANTSSLTSSLGQDGLVAGPSVSVFCRQHTQLRRLV